MADYITGDKADLPGFISTNHTDSRGLKGYDDDTFDSINRKAFEIIKNSKIIDFYNETQADQIAEALAETIRGPEDDLTIGDALAGNARNFFTTLDLENPNVMRAIGQYGFAQAISAGGMVEPVKALLFMKKDEAGRPVRDEQGNLVQSEDAKNWKIRQLLEGLKDAQNTYFTNTAERMINAEYYSDMKGLIGDKIELTNNEYDAFGKEFANWSNVNMPEIAVEEKSDLKGNVYFQLPKPGDKYIIGMANLDNEDVGFVLDIIRELNINKWKRLMKKAVNNLIKLDGAKPQVRGITEKELEEILGGAKNIEEELTQELNDLVDEVDESGMPKQMLAGRRGSRERVTPGNLSSDKPNFERDFTEDKPDEFDEKGRLIKPPVKGSDYDPENPRVDRDIQRIETVNVEDLTRELTPITTLKQFMDNSTIDVKINKKSKVYTVTTKEEDWNLYEEFLGVTEADRAVMKISSPGKFVNKMEIESLKGEDIEEVEEGLSVEIIEGMLETKEDSNKLFVNIKDTLSSLLEDKDIILKYYKMVSEDEINDDEIEETIKPLEEYIGDLTEEELLDKLSNYSDSETLKSVLIPFNKLFGRMTNAFINYTESVRESKEEQIRQDKEADERGEEIQVEAETQEDRMDIRDNTAIETFVNLLEAYEKDIKKLRDYESSDDSIEDLQEAMDEFLATPKGLPFKETYVDILNGEDLNETNRPAVLQRFREYYNIEESRTDEDTKSIVESLIRDDLMEDKSLVDIFTVVITNENTNPKQWGQMTKYTSAGKIQFRLIFRVSDTGKTTAEAQVIYNQEFEIKPVLSESSRIDFTDNKQQAAASIDRRGGQRSVTALGREIKENGFGIDKKKKAFIDKIVERLQQLEMVI